MAKLFCKYCKKRTHRIDECPTIICRGCGRRGHPTWLCPQDRLKRVSEWPAPAPAVTNCGSVWDYLSRSDEMWIDM